MIQKIKQLFIILLLFDSTSAKKSRKKFFKSKYCYKFTDTIKTRYIGTINRTSSGKICQEWNSNAIHTTNKVLLRRAGSRVSWRRPNGTYALASHNFCRNVPFGNKKYPRPWCYTMDIHKRWEYCDVPVCKILGNQRIRHKPVSRPRKDPEISTTYIPKILSPNHEKTISEPTCGLTCNCGGKHQPWVTKTLDSPCSLTQTCAVTNGYPTEFGEYPWQAVIYKKPKLSVTANYIFQHCGGSILNKNTILTAAHCFDSDFPLGSDYMVGVGLERAYPKGKTRILQLNIHEAQVSAKISDIQHEINRYRHELSGRLSDFGAGLHEVEREIRKHNFNSQDFKNDVAILILKNEIKFPENSDSGRTLVRPICLPKLDTIISKIKENQFYPKSVSKSASDCSISGYGGKVKNSKVYHEFEDEEAKTLPLHSAKVHLVSNYSCTNRLLPKLKENYHDMNYISETSICAGNANDLEIDSCAGDSGGPLVCERVENIGEITLKNGDLVEKAIKKQMVLMGLTSYGTELCGIGYPSVFSRVESFLDWVKENSKGNLQFV